MAGICRKSKRGHPYNRTLWGEILLCLMDQGICTSELAYNIASSEEEIRLALITMHQFDLIKPIAVRTENGLPDSFGYGQDILWETTIHTKEHIDTVQGCHGCWVREELLFEVLTE